MKLFLKTLILCSLLFFQVAESKIYKWRDKDGKLHYSEEKPQSEQEVSSLDIGSGKKFIASKIAQPFRSKNKNERHIVIVKPERFWEINQPEKITSSYFFGGDCVPGASVSFQDMKDNHPYLLPAANSLVDYVINPIRQLDYSVTSSNKNPLARNLARFENPLVLRFSYSDLQLHLCLFDLKQKARSNDKKRFRSEPFDFSERDFNRRRVNITLNWRLEDPETGEMLFNTTTSGSADYWQKDINKYKLKVFKKAIENSANNLFSDPRFIDLLKAKARLKPKAVSKIAIPKLKEAGLFDNLQNRLVSGAQKKTKFSVVLSTITPLKMMSVEYYLSHGSWPSKLSDIGITRNDMVNDKYIRDIQFDFNGAIVLNLNKEEFEENAMLSLQPKVRMGGSRIDWQCLSNLDNSYYGEICNRVE